MMLLLLLGCPTADPDPCDDKPDCDTGDTAPDDTDDSADDTDVDDTDDSGDTDSFDTGIAAMFWVGEFTTSAGEYVDARFGYGAYGLAMEDWACFIDGTLPYEGDAPAGCPDCDWAFDLGPATGSVASGDYCADFGISDGAIDGYFDYAWGFASTYYYDYNGTPLPLENTLVLYADGAWFPWSFNYGGRYWSYGDAEHLEIQAPMWSGGGYAYYYYYP